MNDSIEENNSDEMFDPSEEMPSWLRLNFSEFIYSIAHEIREESLRARVHIQAFEKDPDIASRAIKSIWGPRTIEENSSEIRKHLNRIRQLTIIASEYAHIRHLDSDDNTPET